MLIRTLIFLWLAAAAFASTAQAQIIMPSSGSGETVELPSELTPDLVDGLLSRLTDGEIRTLLREELLRQAEADAAVDEGPSSFDAIATRLEEMRVEIFDTRFPRWANRLANLDQRWPTLSKRIGESSHGLIGMLIAATALIGAATAAAYLVSRLTRPWREWLTSPKRDAYWDKVVRTGALAVVEAFPLILFILVTNALIPLLSEPLGRLTQMRWIYTTGVTEGWAVVIVARRAFAPDAPMIRIAPLEDDAAKSLYRLLRSAAIIVMGGWMLAGLSFHMGLTLVPAMILNALAGSIAAALFLAAVVTSGDRIRHASAAVFGGGEDAGAFSRIAVAISPVALALFVLWAWIYWLALWLENGQHYLEGPLGTMLVYLTLPIFDKMGDEIVRSAIRADTAVAIRFRRVFHGFWRLLIGIFSAVFVLSLWGLDLIGLIADAEKPAWFGVALNIAAALLMGYVLWRLVRAALHVERRVSDASEDVDPSEIPSASRLETLTPLFRNVILFFLAAVMLMIVLSSLGVDIGPLIASAGIIGIAVGFGAQALVRDVLSGVFFLIDDAFRVGEYIELENDMRGEVENISVRSLQIRHHRGPVITIPFGELRHITNHNRDWVIYKMMFRMEPDTDPQKLKKVVKRVGAEFMEHPVHGPKFIEPLKSQGVYYIDDDSALVIRVKFKCKPRAQFVLRRDIYHRLRIVFAEEGFRLARRKVEVVTSDGAAADPKVAGALPEEVITNPPVQPVA
ncbi:MAG: mechanosensitive ion channel family protein [Pseudomonadota bacterium]